MNLRNLTLNTLLAVLAGCATGPVDYTATREGWQGARYETVVAMWGAPTRSTVLADGRDAHTWVSESFSGGGNIYPSVGVFGGSRGTGVGIGTGILMGGGGVGGGELIRCERTLMFRDDRVVEQTWQGHSSYCSNFRRN